MGNVHPYPRYLSRESSLHSHPTPMKKYALLCTHLGCKSAIKRMVHLLLCDAEVLLTRGSIRLVPPANKPFPCLPCCSPPACCPHPEQKKMLSQGSCSWVLAVWTAPPSQPSQCCPLPITGFPCPHLRFDSLLPSRQNRCCTGPSGLDFYVTLCD